MIKCLENYHKKYNEKTQAYSETPLHDWTSHMCDAVRMMANARIQFGRGPGTMNKEKLNELKRNAGFGPSPKSNMQILNQPFGRS